MLNITQVIDSLENKLSILLERYDFLKEENELLRGEIAELQQDLIHKEQLLKEKETEFDSLVVAKTIQGSNNTELTTQKIQTLIREIDSCIDLLSD